MSKASKVLVHLIDAALAVEYVCMYVCISILSTQLLMNRLTVNNSGGKREKAKKNDCFRDKRSSHVYSAGKVRCNDPLLLFISKSIF